MQNFRYGNGAGNINPRGNRNPEGEMSSNSEHHTQRQQQRSQIRETPQQLEMNLNVSNVHSMRHSQFQHESYVQIPQQMHPQSRIRPHAHTQMPPHTHYPHLSHYRAEQYVTVPPPMHLQQMPPGVAHQYVQYHGQYQDMYVQTQPRHTPHPYRSTLPSSASIARHPQHITSTFHPGIPHPLHVTSSSSSHSGLSSIQGGKVNVGYIPIEIPETKKYTDSSNKNVASDSVQGTRTAKHQIGTKRKLNSHKDEHHNKRTKKEKPKNEKKKTAQCMHEDCKQLAGEDGLCSSHKGQWTCLEPGCNEKVRRARTKCSEHSVLKRCSIDDCESKAVSGRGIFRRCIIHGGGRRCRHSTCNTSALKGGFCSKHGGGRRCSVLNCEATARKGFSVCYKHGGRNECKDQNCEKLDAGRGFCIRHGGGRRCKIENCAKSALRLGLCAKHGGAKRCKVEACTKSAPRAGLCPLHGNYVS